MIKSLKLRSQGEPAWCSVPETLSRQFFMTFLLAKLGNVYSENTIDKSLSSRIKQGKVQIYLGFYLLIRIFAQEKQNLKHNHERTAITHH